MLKSCVLIAPSKMTFKTSHLIVSEPDFHEVMHYFYNFILISAIQRTLCFALSLHRLVVVLMLTDCESLPLCVCVCVCVCVCGVCGRDLVTINIQSHSKLAVLVSRAS